MNEVVRQAWQIMCLMMAWSIAFGGADPVGVISPSELAARLVSGDAPAILDVRTPEEFAAGHIPGAINIPHTEIGARIAEIDSLRDREVVVHCRSGRRAMLAEEILSRAGFSGIRMLDGHIVRWKEDGYPVE